MESVAVPENVKEAHSEFQLVDVGPPAEYKDSGILTIECLLVPMQGGPLDGACVFNNYWKPSEEEIEAIKNGALIQLSFIADGIPPHLVSLVSPDPIKEINNG